MNNIQQLTKAKFVYEESSDWNIGDIIHLVGTDNKLSKYLIISSEDSRRHYRTKGYDSTIYNLFSIEENKMYSHTVINKTFDV
jgi:hypothetical protein